MSKQPLIENIEKIIDIKNNIRNSIINQGVDVSENLSFAAYPMKIDSIGPGVHPKEPGYVTFYDYDGKVLYAFSQSEILELDELPIPPDKDDYYFDGWNWTLEEIKAEGKKVNVGALYRHKKGYNFTTTITVNTEGAKEVIVDAINPQSGRVNVDWGDGLSTQGDGTTTISHIYDSYGEYTIGINTYGSMYCRDYLLSGINLAYVKEIGLGEVTLDADSIIYFYNLESVYMSSLTECNTNGNKMFAYSYKLKHINLPRVQAFTGFYSTGLESISIPGNVETIKADFDCPDMTKLYIPNSVTSYSGSIGSNIEELLWSKNVRMIDLRNKQYLTRIKLYSINTAFPQLANCSRLYVVDMTDFNSVLSLLGTSLLSGTNRCYFIVKDNLVNTWKNSKNWSSYASRIIGETDWNNNPRPYQY